MYSAWFEPARKDATGCAESSVCVTTRAGPVPLLSTTRFDECVSYAFTVTYDPSTWMLLAVRRPTTVTGPLTSRLDEVMVGTLRKDAVMVPETSRALLGAVLAMPTLPLPAWT